ADALPLGLLWHRLRAVALLSAVARPARHRHLRGLAVGEVMPALRQHNNRPVGSGVPPDAAAQHQAPVRFTLLAAGARLPLRPGGEGLAAERRVVGAARRALRLAGAVVSLVKASVTSAVAGLLRPAILCAGLHLPSAVRPEPTHERFGHASLLRPGDVVAEPPAIRLECEGQPPGHPTQLAGLQAAAALRPADGLAVESLDVL